MPLRFPVRIPFLAALFAITMMTAVPARAQLIVTEPWVRASVAGQTATGAFMKLEARTPLTLVDVRAALARAELHTMENENNIMRMRRISRLPLDVGQVTNLAPGGSHIMLMELSAPLRAGDMVDLTLVVEHADARREEYPVRAVVRALNAPQP